MSRKHEEEGHWARRVSLLMINFSIIYMDLFPMMKRRLARNETADLSENESRASRMNLGAQPTPLARLVRMKKIALLWHRLIMAFYLFEMTRYLLIDLLAFDAFQDYQLLDCFILGRFRFIGRTNKISGRVVLIIALIIGIYRVLAFKVFVTSFRVQAVEFLMYEQRQVLLEEIKFELLGRRERRQRKPLGRCPAASKGRLKWHLLPSTQSAHVNSAFYLRRLPNLMHESAHLPRPLAARSGPILRPNRTGKCWRQLDILTRFAAYLTVVAALAWCWLIFANIRGSIGTDLGFELGYSSCVKWLQRQQSQAINSTSEATNLSAGTPPFAWIYVAPPVVAPQMSIDDIPAIIQLNLRELRYRNPYQLICIAFDIINNAMWYSHFILVVLGTTYLVVLSSLDIVLNAAEIHLRLSAIVAKLVRAREISNINHEFMDTLQRLHEAPSGGVQSYKWQTAHLEGRYVRKRAEQRQDEQLINQIDTIQAILADHFKLVGDYNHFVSLIMMLVLGTWFSYSFLMCIWIGSVHSTAVEFEFLVTEIGLTFFAVMFFSSAAIARSLNYRLYSLIARAMAHDAHHSASKLRWLTIMKFYSPKAKYCFTLFGFVEITSLFCIRFVWWIVSAYIVLTKFFFVNGEQSGFF